jgi:hypothetical protein
MITANFRYPTREEIDALVRAARRERAQAIAGFFRDAFSLLAGRGLAVDRRGSRFHQQRSAP